MKGRRMRRSLKVQTTDIDQQIGARVREFRLLRSMSQEALAERLGITFQQLQKYEKRMNRVSASALILICKELGITPNHILGSFFDDDKDATLVHQLMHQIAVRDRRLKAIQAAFADESPRLRPASPISCDPVSKRYPAVRR